MRRLIPLALVFSTILLVTTDCDKGAVTPSGVVPDVQIGLDAAACLLRQYSADKAKGLGETACIADAAIKCGVTAAQTIGLLSEHHAATALEAKAAQGDGGVRGDQ
jgi:hypothetical protein